MRARELIGLAVLCLGPAACDDGPQADIIAQADFLFVLAPGERSRFELTGTKGSVVLRGDDREPNVVVGGIRWVRAGSADQAGSGLLQLSVETSKTEDAIQVETVQPEDDLGREYVVDFDVTLPPGMTLQIDHVEGDVDLSGTTGGAGLHIVSGNVTASLAIPGGGTIDIEVVDGDLTLLVPASTSASVDAATADGTLTVEGLSLEVQEQTERSVTGTLGGGAGAILLRVTRGDIRLGTP